MEEDGGEGVDGVASTTAILNDETKSRKNQDTDIQAPTESMRWSKAKLRVQFQPVLGLLLRLSWQRNLKLGTSQKTGTGPKQRKSRRRGEKRSIASMRELILGRESHAWFGGRQRRRQDGRSKFQQWREEKIISRIGDRFDDAWGWMAEEESRISGARLENETGGGWGNRQRWNGCASPPFAGPLEAR